MLEVLFTTSDKSLAKLIRWATGEKSSHCALLWDNIVIHSNWKGVNVQFLNDFLKENRVIHRVEVQENHDKITNAIVSGVGTLYDIGALLFCGIVLFCRKALGLKSWPKMNLWQSSGMYLCTEFVSEYLFGKADSLITPDQLYERIKKQ